ncbi:MAG: helix-turn-helix transcriptional regulator [Vicinamibacterales bacterium]
MSRSFLGEFEHRVLLALLGAGPDATPRVARERLGRAGQDVSRGALYTTLDRLEAKGLLRWTSVPGGPARDGLPERRYDVTPAGLDALRASRRALLDLWEGLEGVLEG